MKYEDEDFVEKLGQVRFQDMSLALIEPIQRAKERKERTKTNL